jgi:O6-methylguanine-DNA--protein-cysteine methyltransferase
MGFDIIEVYEYVKKIEPIDPPDDAAPDPVARADAAGPDDAAPAWCLAKIARLESLVDEFAREKAAVLAQQAEAWTTIKRSAATVNHTYGWVQTWAKRAVDAGRLNEARKVGGAVRVNQTALIAACRCQ